MTQTTVILITLVAYKLVLIGIGIWASRRVHSATDFLLGGRGLGPWVAGLSYAASTSSAWVLLGYSGFVYAFGVAALWMVPGIWAGYVVMWLWFGPRVRGESAAEGWVTPTEFLSANLEARAAARLAALAAALIGFCFIFYIAAQFAAAATAFTTNFSMSESSSLLLGAGIVLIYCLLGGFWAASVTDTLQAVIMMLVAVLVPAFAVIEVGGPGQILANVSAIGGSYASFTGGYAGLLFVGMLLGFAGIGLGTLGQPHLLARLMAVKGERERRLGFLIAIGWGVTVYIGMTWMALAARSLTPDLPSGEQVFYLLAETLLPPVLAGIVIAAILSAVMSTVDSLLLAASAAVSHDLSLAERFDVSDLKMSRIVMTGIVVGAVTLALVLPDTIFNRVLFAWNALGAAFGPIIIARVLKREPPGAARFWSIVTGFSLTVVFYLAGTVDAAAVTGPVAAIAALAQLPGDPFERVVPFVPPLLMLFLWPQARGAIGLSEPGYDRGG
ncbi:MAG: sodium/proline symporter [Pseudomonadota bacterium]